MLPCPEGTWTNLTDASSTSDCLAASLSLRPRGCPAGQILASNALSVQSSWSSDPVYGWRQVSSLSCRSCGWGPFSSTPGACFYGAVSDTWPWISFNYQPDPWMTFISSLSSGGTHGYTRATIPAPQVAISSGDLSSVFKKAYVYFNSSDNAYPCPNSCANVTDACFFTPACVACPGNYACADDFIVRCPVGQYSESGASACSNCSAGSSGVSVGTYYGYVPLSAGCAACAAGRYSETAGTSSCAQCPSATFTNGTGSSSAGDCLPLPCQTGAYIDPTHPSVCTACPPGTASSGVYPGLSSCSICSFGTFASASVGASSCVSCPGGTWSLVQGRTACE